MGGGGGGLVDGGILFVIFFPFVKVAWYFQAPAFRQVSSTLFFLLLSVTCKLFCNNSGNK